MRSFLVVLFALVSVGSEGFAQITPEQSQALSGQANPGRVEQQLDRGNLLSEIGPQERIGAIESPDMPANADKLFFNLKSIEFIDVSVYDEEDLRPLYAQKLGTNVSLADIFEIASVLTSKYRNDGYILSQVKIPPQEIENGAVKIQAFEGYIDQISIIDDGGEPQSSLDLIRSYAEHIRDSGPLHKDQLERYLLLMNDLPGLSAGSVLNQSPVTIGASDLIIQVERAPYEGVLGANSYGSRYLGPIQLTAGAQSNSFFGYNESISAQFATAPHSGELYFLLMGYTKPVGTYGSKLNVLYSRSRTDPGFDLSQFDVNGKSEFASISLSHPFIRTRTRNFQTYATIDWRNVESFSNIEPTREDNIRALRFGGQFNYTGNLLGISANTFSFELAKGIDILNATNKNNINVSRPEGNPRFEKLNISVQRLQRLNDDFNMFLSVSGQLSNGPLYTSEEFGVGGGFLGRGYDPSEIIGDEGFSTSFELQWNSGRSLGFIDTYQLYGFYDFGKVRNDDATIDDNDESLASTGFGIRGSLDENIDFETTFALPLTRDVQTQGDQGARLQFSLERSF